MKLPSLRAYAAVTALIFAWPGAAPLAKATVDGIFFTEVSTFSILRADVDGSNVTTLLNGLQAHGLAADPLARQLYVAVNSAGTVSRLNYDGSSFQNLFGFGSPQNVVLDSVNSKLYTTGFGGVGIARSNVDGSGLTPILPGIIVRGLALDSVNGHIYFGSLNSNQLLRIDLDGSNLTTVASGLGNITAVALDPVSGQVFVTANSNVLFACNLDGSNARTIRNVGGTLQDMEIDSQRGHLYIADSNNVYRCDINGSNLVIAVSGRNGIRGIELSRRVNRTYATVGSPVPGIAGSTFKSFSQPVVNSFGGVAFDALIKGGTVTSTTDRTLWATLMPGTVTLVAREGGPTGIADVNFKAWDMLHLANGVLVFKAKLAGTSVTPANDDSMWAWDANGLRLLAREGDAAPNGGNWRIFGFPTINDSGSVFFQGSTTISTSLFKTGPNAMNIVPALERGQLLELDGTEVVLSTFTQRQTNIGNRLYSNTGYFGTVLKLGDGRTALVVLAE